MNGITKETFKDADTDTKLDILFDYRYEDHMNIKKILDLLSQHPKNCQTRFEKLESRSVKDTLLSAGFGFVGGFAAMAAKLKWWD